MTLAGDRKEEALIPCLYSVPGNSSATFSALTRPHCSYWHTLNVVVSDAVAWLAVRTYRAYDNPF
jgi:hypothetical protein